MADLFDRIITNPDNEEPVISGHYLPAMVTSYHNGDTALSIKNFFNMDVDASNDFDALITHFDTLADLQKLEFMLIVEASIARIELEIITTKAQWVSFVGI